MSFTHSRLLALLLLIVATSIFSGCDGRPKRVPIAGAIYIDGQPLPKAEIRVIPADGRSAQAVTDNEGRFKLYTFDYENFDGAILGEHPVEIRAAAIVPGGTKYLIPKKYFQAATSGVTLKVEKPDDNVRIDLTWDGGAPFIEASENQGHAAPVGAVPAETTTPTPTTEPAPTLD